MDCRGGKANWKIGEPLVYIRFLASGRIIKMERIGVGLIGCGWAGQQHARAYALLRDHVDLIAVADIDPEKARSLALEYGFSSWHKDYVEILSNPKVEVISICLPIYLHAKVSIEAAEMGKHILCEKPMAGSVKEADAMIRAAKRSNVKLMIAENVRFNPINLRLKELIEDGILGEIFLVRMFRDHELHGYIKARPWMLDRRRAAGGIWMSGGIHDVDAMRMLIGEIETVSLFQTRKVLHEIEGDETSVGILRFFNGAIGVLTESYSTRTFRSTFPIGCPSIINGSEGTIMVYQDEIEIYGESTGKNSCVRSRVERRDTFLEEIKHFIRCVREDKEPITSGEEERKSLAVICAGYESLRKGGTPIHVEY
ncbi:hypothetical protein DRO28_01550 [Candidatus Bathyarchaeota archaeon]|nr:MAG: hypothetical protein DRO28_01550 [Candidatus Bathyarchaeota archaeon]